MTDTHRELFVMMRINGIHRLDQGTLYKHCQKIHCDTQRQAAEPIAESINRGCSRINKKLETALWRRTSL